MGKTAMSGTTANGRLVVNEFLIPASLYRTRGGPLREWRSLAKRITQKGWKDGLAGVEHVNAFDLPGLFLLDSLTPRKFWSLINVFPHFAMYAVNESFITIHSKTKLDDRACRDFILEGLDYPWYALSMLWPQSSYHPPMSFSTDAERQYEEKKFSKIAARKLACHFPVLHRARERFSQDGLFDSVFPMEKLHALKLLTYCVQAGVTDESRLSKLLELSADEAEKEALNCAGCRPPRF